MSEAEAIEGAKSGDGECFDFLYRVYRRRVYSLCLRMTGVISKAEDLTQEVLQLYRKIVTFRGDLMHRLTFSLFLTHLHNNGLLNFSLDEMLEPTEEIGPITGYGAENRVFAGSIDYLILESAIGSLSPGRRIIFVLHDVEGYEHNEIAEIFGCSIGSSRSQLRKARMKLRRVLNITRAKCSHLIIETRQQMTMAIGQVASAAATDAVRFLQCWR